MINIALADDQQLVRQSFINMLTSINNFTVVIDAPDGSCLIEQIFKKQPIPDVAIIDICMPVMNGFETTLYLKKNFPLIKVLALSMYDNIANVIRILKCGADGFISKNSKIEDMEEAIISVNNGLMYLDNALLQDAKSKVSQLKNTPGLNELEIQFLQLLLLDLSYPEIAERMFKSSRTIEHYRDSLFEKFSVHTKLGLILFALKNKIVDFN